MNNYIEVKNFSFSYDSKNKIIDDVSFSLCEDDILIIIGPSGDGKTTLLKLMAGLLYEDDGDIFIDGKSQKEIKPCDRKISYLFQNTSLYSSFTIYQNLMMGLKNQKMDDYSKNQLIQNYLHIFKITKFINLKPNVLSNGERQKVAIAKCLLSNDNLYLLDEPFSSLDINSKKDILMAIKAIFKEKKKPIIIVSHDFSDVKDIGSKLLVINKGKVLQFGEINDVINNPISSDVYKALNIKVNYMTIDNQEYAIPIHDFYEDENGPYCGIVNKTFIDEDGKCCIEIRYDDTNLLIVSSKIVFKDDLIRFSFIKDNMIKFK